MEIFDWNEIVNVRVLVALPIPLSGEFEAQPRAIGTNTVFSLTCTHTHTYIHTYTNIQTHMYTYMHTHANTVIKRPHTNTVCTHRNTKYTKTTIRKKTLNLNLFNIDIWYPHSSMSIKRLTIFVPKAEWTFTLKQSILWCKMYVPPSDAFENCRFGGWEHGFHVSAGLQGSPQVPGVDGNDRIHFIPPPSRHLGNNNALLSAWRSTLKHLGEILWKAVRKHYE